MLRKIKKIKIPFKKVLIKLAEKAFLTFLGLLVLALIFAGFLFYKYSFLAAKSKPEFLVKPPRINEEVFEKVLSELANREKKFKEADSKVYLNPFINTAIPEEVPAEGGLTE